MTPSLNCGGGDAAKGERKQRIAEGRRQLSPEGERHLVTEEPAYFFNRSAPPLCKFLFLDAGNISRSAAFHINGAFS